MAELVKKGGRVHGRRFLCGVPERVCCGSGVSTPGGDRKAHSTSFEAAACMERYLLREGFKKVGNREFEDPESGYVRVLTKKSRFGMALRPGKENRFMSRTFPGGGIGSI